MNKRVCTVIHLANGGTAVNKKGKVLLLMHVERWAEKEANL